MGDSSELYPAVVRQLSFVMNVTRASEGDHGSEVTVKAKITAMWVGLLF
jgi:hypothetical protein